MSEKTKIYEEKMEKSLLNLNAEFQGIRAGRANPHVLDKITIDYYGSPTPIQQVANVSVPEARMIQISPWDPKITKEIVKAIQKSDIGINPSDDGHLVRLVFPELTEERRKDLVKEVRKKGEDAKIAIRNIRRDGLEACKKMKKQDGVSEDEIADIEDELQKITEEYTERADEAIEAKSKEIMKV
jgi:ribosome recycling factor